MIHSLIVIFCYIFHQLVVHLTFNAHNTVYHGNDDIFEWISELSITYIFGCQLSTNEFFSIRLIHSRKSECASLLCADKINAVADVLAVTPVTCYRAFSLTVEYNQFNDSLFSNSVHQSTLNIFLMKFRRSKDTGEFTSKWKGFASLLYSHIIP